MGNSQSHRDVIPETEPVWSLRNNGAVISTHQGYRNYQEDDYDMDSLDLHGEELRMYTVLDGHGGKGAVKHCKRTILLNIRQFLQYETEYTLEECLKQSFIKTEQNLTLLYQHSAPDLSELLIDSVPGLESEVQLPLTSETQLDIWPPPPLTSIIPKHFKVKKFDDGSGCCALVCLIQAKKMVLANCGDCRALLVYKDGSFIALIEEHRPTLPEEYERVLAAGLQVHGDRVNGELAVSRSIGDFKYKGASSLVEEQAVTCIPSISSIEIMDYMESLVLMSDGIYEGITMDQLVNYLHSPMTLEEQVKQIISHCIQPGGSSDNMTLMVIPLN
jgi:serine/threonine protein phosphatase PrpC